MKQRVIALGFFDGVHLGHGALLRRTRELAEQYGVQAAALTFDRHPDELVHGISVPLLNTSREREGIMATYYGIEELLTLPFDRARMAQPWQDFVKQSLRQEYGAIHVVCGYDFRFGSRGLGDASKLAELCGELGMGCDCIPEVIIEGNTVSSTLIRRLLSQTEPNEALRLLGHPHILSGTVVSGRKLGRTIGIPTANLSVGEEILLPKTGVYAAMTRIEGKSYLAVTNIGSRPTVGGRHITVEPWILDYSGDLYGQELSLELYRYLRPERSFDSLEALKEEILHNAEQTKHLLSQELLERNQTI